MQVSTGTEWEFNQLGKAQSELGNTLEAAPEQRAMLRGMSNQTQRNKLGIPFQAPSATANAGPGREYWLP